MKASPHERFSKELVLAGAQVSEFARVVGDSSPLHNDPEIARRSRFGRLIASGAQTTGHLMALTAHHFWPRSPMVGLEFAFYFRRPVFVDELIKLEWLVIRSRHSERLRGEIVDLRGRIRNEAGETAVGAKGQVLLSAHLFETTSER